MTTPRGIHAAYQVRVDRINSQPKLSEATRRALIARAYVDTREQLRAARAAYRDTTDPTPAATAENTTGKTMSDLIRGLAARGPLERERATEAIAFSLAVPRELADLQHHEIERLAADGDNG